MSVHESIADEFVNRLAERTEAIERGGPLDPATEIGTVASEAQFEKVREYVKIATGGGADVLTSETPEWTASESLFFPPTVLTGVTTNMRIAREEVFGPILSVLTFESEEEVIREANNSRFGLAAGVWTADLRRGIRMTERLEAGVVWVNTYRKSSFIVPFGGFKDSGVGRKKGVEGIEEYLQTKSVWIETEGQVSDPFQMI